MAKFEYASEPKIDASDLKDLDLLLKTFDKVTFNYGGEFIASLKTTIPMIGKIVISMQVHESHVYVYREDAHPGDDDLLSIYLYDMMHDHEPGQVIDKDELIMYVKTKIREEIAKNL